MNKKTAQYLAIEYQKNRRACVSYLVSRYHLTEDDAGDIYSDVFTRLLSHRYRFSPRRFFPYLVQALKNRALNQVRRDKRTEPLSRDLTDEEQLDPLGALPPNRLARAVAILSGSDAIPWDQRHLLLPLLDGYSVREVATLYGVSPHAVHRALRRVEAGAACRN